MREHYIFVYVYNLRDYVLRRAVMLYTLNEWVVNAYCHRTIKLSGAVSQASILYNTMIL